MGKYSSVILVAAVASIAVAAGAASTVVSVNDATFKQMPWFSPNSPWNVPIGTSPTVLVAYSSPKITAVSSLNLNLDYWTSAVIFAPVGTPTQTVKWSVWSMQNVPITQDVIQAADYFKSKGDTDSSVCIYSEANGLTYSMNGVKDLGNGTVSVSSGSVYDLTGSGWWDNSNKASPWGGSASGRAGCAGLVRPEELASGAINHALTGGWPHNLILTTAVYPAVTSDGGSTNTATSLPMGSLLQLDPTLTDKQLTSMGLKANDLVLAHALQKYGYYISDSSGAFSMSFAAGLGNSGKYYPNVSSKWPSAFMTHFRVIAPPTTPYVSTVTRATVSTVPIVKTPSTTPGFSYESTMTQADLKHQ